MALYPTCLCHKGTFSARRGAACISQDRRVLVAVRDVGGGGGGDGRGVGVGDDGCGGGGVLVSLPRDVLEKLRKFPPTRACSPATPRGAYVAHGQQSVS